MNQLYIFTGTIPNNQFRDDTGFLDKQGIGPGSTFEVTFKINKNAKYQPPGDPGFYMTANYVAGTLKNRFIGNGSLYDKVVQGEPSASINTPAVPTGYSFELYDNSKGFDEWNVGHTVQVHYEHKVGNKISSFDAPLTLQMITPNLS